MADELHHAFLAAAAGAAAISAEQAGQQTAARLTVFGILHVLDFARELHLPAVHP